MDEKLREFEPFELKHKSETIEIINSMHRRILLGRPLSSKRTHAMLYEISKGLHHEVEGHVLEFGVFTGMTSAFIALGISSMDNYNKLYAIDPYDFMYEALGVARHTFKLLEIEKHVVQIIMKDTDFLTEFWGKRPIRMVFVDSDHGHEDTRKVLEMVLPLVVRDGFILVHDYDRSVPTVVPAVNSFIDEYVSSFSIKRLGSTVCMQKIV